MKARKKVLVPRCAHHTQFKLPYVAWHIAAEERTARGDRQVQCPVCHLWLFAEEVGVFPTPLGDEG